MMANLLAPSITIPTRITTRGGTLIDNIFTNSILPDKCSGNLAVSISDHLPSFLIIPMENKKSNSPSKIQYKQDTKYFSRDDFIFDYLDIDWNSKMEIYNIIVTDIRNYRYQDPPSVFVNMSFINKCSGNLAVSISDHLPSFLIIPMENKKSNSQNKIQYKRDTRNFSRDDFILDYLNIDWDSEMEIEKNDVDHSTEKFFSNMNNLIDKHMPIRKLSAKERKQKTHPWITPAIIAKINRKNELYKSS